MKHLFALLIAFNASLNMTFAQDPEPAPPLPAPDFSKKEAWPEAWFEIFRLAPGQHEAFMRIVAQDDEVAAAGGLPPTRLYIHQHGDDWDVLLLKIVGEHETTPEQDAAMAAKRKELGLPSGPAYFVNLRKTVASHTDSKTIGPVSAAQWLARLDQWREDNPGREPLAPTRKKK